MAQLLNQPMGMGQLGKTNVVFKRKFRWTFEVQTNCPVLPNIPESFVKLAARPNLSIEETEINFLNGKMWIPGKGTWETISVTYYDVSGTDGDMSFVYSWIASVYNFLNPVLLTQSSSQAGYGGIATLNLYDGCGTAMETWTLGDMWPQAINFGELDYAASEECTVELTLRYSQVAYQAQNNCAKQPIAACAGCGPCAVVPALGSQG